jgi:DNA polymerase III sliding clamp (beta) subunit (PCNA family)
LATKASPAAWWGWLFHRNNKNRKDQYMNQEIILPAGEFKAGLPSLAKIIGKSKTLPVLTAVRIARDDQGKVSLQATDLNSFATYIFKEPQPGPATALLLPLEQLTKASKGLSAEDTLGLIVEGKDRVRLRYSIAGSIVEQSLRGFPADEWPLAPKINSPAVPLEPGFGLALKQALECCGEDPTRAIINGVFLDVRNQKLPYLVSTNGKVLFCTNSFRAVPLRSVVIPDSKFLEWTDLMDEPQCSLSVEPGQAEQPAKDGQPYQPAEPGWVKFESPRWTFLTQEIQGQFPDWRQVLPDTSSLGTLINLSEEALKQMLQIIPRLPGDDSPDYPIRLRADGRHLLLEGQDKDQQEWTSIPIQNVRVAGKPVALVLNRQYLAKALRFGLNKVEIEGSLCPVLFSNEGKKLVIMPVSL